MAVSIFDSKKELLIYKSGYTSFNEGVERHQLTETKGKINFETGNASFLQLALPEVSIFYNCIQVSEPKIAYVDMRQEPEFVEMHFTLEGNGFLQSDSTGTKYYFEKGKQNLHYMPIMTGTGKFEKDMTYTNFEIRFSKSFFLSIANCSPVLIDFANEVEGNNVSEVYKSNIPISFRMLECISDIINNPFKDGLQQMFLQSKGIELLTLQVQAYETYSEKRYKNCKTKCDLDRIHFAGEYLLKHIFNPPSLIELAKIANTNVFKLKKDFKEVFDNTVYGYLNDHRLNMARNKLLTGSSIKELSYELGYSSVQHFSKAFKKRFGVSPGRVKQ